MNKMERINRFFWIATVVVLVVGVIGNLVFFRQIAQEDANAAMRLAEINAKANAPAKRYSFVDSDGITRHTLCSGGGWCVTDRVPPDDFTKAASVNKSSGIPVIDVAFIAQVLEAQTPPKGAKPHKSD